MNIKFCYKDEIHKTFFPPATFKSLLEEIKTSFGDRLPSNFILQYKDKDGDLITMSSDLEYSSMLRFDTPRTRTSFKVFIVPVEEKEASFELVEASQSFSEDCMREFSLSSNSERKLSRSPSERNIDSPQKSTSRCSRPKSLSFSDCDGEEGSELMSPELELPADLSNELTQLYKAREMIIQEYLSNSPSKASNSKQTRKTVKVLENANLLAHEDQDIYPSDSLDDSLALKEIDKFMAELAIKKEKAKLLSLPKQEIRQYKPEKYCLQKNDIQVCSTECYVSNNTEPLNLGKQNYTEYRANTSSYYTPYQAFEGTKLNEIQLIPFQMYSYETIVGLSSSILFLEDNEGHGTAYKTVYLKNTGMKPWKKCLVKPVGVLPGKTVEISNVEVGSIALVTLEVSGCFNIGIYDSQWRLVHENDYGVVETIGEPFNVNFIIDEANIMAAKGDAKSSKCDSFSEDKAKSSTEGTFREDSEEDELEDEDQEEGNGSTEEENMYGIGGPYSKEYLEYRDQITNKAKELKKIFPDDTPDEIIKFVMEKPELNFEDLLVAYLAMKDGATDY